MKFLFFTSSYVISHISHCLETGKALQARGHEVVLAAGDPNHPRSKLSLATDAGLRVALVREIDQPYVWDRFMARGWWAPFNDFSHLARWAPLYDIIESQVDLIRTEQPDLVIGASTVTASTAAHIAGVPGASLFNAYFLDYVLTRPALRHYWWGYERFTITPLRRRAYRRFGRKPADSLALFQSIPLVSPDLPGLYTVSKWLPQTYMTGPIMFDYPGRLPAWFDELDNDTPNVYITMGSTGRFESFLENAYRALHSCPYRFIVTTGGQASDAVVREAPDNFCITRFAPGSLILQRSQAAIFHGGNGTMYQALHAGVPMLAVPAHLEQRINANIGVRNGFCMRLQPRRATGERLVSAIETLLNEESYRQSARHWAQAIKKTNGAQCIAELLERFAREGKPAGAELT